jgi:CRP-like cAMP-binding protein
MFSRNKSALLDNFGEVSFCRGDHICGVGSKNKQVDDAIRRNDALSKVRGLSRERLAAGAAFQRFEKGATICHQDSPATRFWVVLRGHVKLVRYSSRGVAISIELVLPNELFGALFHERTRVYPWTAVAATPTHVISFRIADLTHELEVNPQLQKKLLADTCYKLCQAQRMRGLWLEAARVRIAHALLYLYEKFGRTIPQTRAVLAELAGTSPETAIRISTAMVRLGIVATRRGQIEIVSLADLRKCAHGEEPAL